MELTVSGLLKINILKDAELIAGHGGIDRQVSGITIMEAPDIAQWVKGEELILTSLYTLNALSESDQINIIKGLYKKNISSIGFKRRKKEEKIPQVLLDLGNEYNIPIILLPTEVPFIDIMNPVMAEIFNNQMIKLKYYKEIHDRFTKLSLAYKDIKNIIKALEDLLKNPVAVYDKRFNCICTTDQDITKFDILEEDYNIYKDLSKDLKYSKQKVVYSNLDNKEVEQIIVPIETVNNIQVYLVVSQINKELKDLDYIAIESAATVICLELVRQFSVAEVEKKFKGDLIDDLVSGKIEKVEELHRRANLIGLDMDHKYIVCVLNINTKGNELKIQNMLYDTINKYISNVFIRSVSNRITLLWDINDYTKSDDYSIERVKEVLVTIQNLCKEQFKNIVFTAGISNPINKIENISKGYKEAIEALELGNMIYDKGSITTFEELGILRFICKFSDKDELINFIPEEIHRLIEYDSTSGNQFLDTLEIFLNCGCNASKTAKKMYIHYKTVMYRLERIKEIAGIDFNDNDRMLEVQVGFKILKVIENRKKNH